MKVVILDVARLEFNEAKEFYEIEQTGLGAKFSAISRNLTNPAEVPFWPFASYALIV